MILIIDNYDSFTYNLYQYIGTFEPDVKVVRNDKITVEEIEKMNPDKIVLSPGPKSPREAGICVEAVKYFYDKKPVLGICLGHQSIGYAFGGEITYAKELFHGKQSVIRHTGNSVFKGIPDGIKIARYHSLAIKPDTLPSCLNILAMTSDGEIMAVEHRKFPTIGLQFHPESIYTEHGKRMIENFINEVEMPCEDMNEREVEIAQASISDAEAIAMINYEMGFKYPANRVAAQLESLLINVSARVFVARMDGNTIGYIHLKPRETLYEVPSIDVMCLAVRKNYQGRGVGLRLLKESENYAKRMGFTKVTVRFNNDFLSVFRFYEKQGFVYEGQEGVFGKEVRP